MSLIVRQLISSGSEESHKTTGSLDRKEYKLQELVEMCKSLDKMYKTLKRTFTNTFIKGQCHEQMVFAGMYYTMHNVLRLLITYQLCNIWQCVRAINKTSIQEKLVTEVLTTLSYY